MASKSSVVAYGGSGPIDDAPSSGETASHENCRSCEPADDDAAAAASWKRRLTIDSSGGTVGDTTSGVGVTRLGPYETTMGTAACWRGGEGLGSGVGIGRGAGGGML